MMYYLFILIKCFLNFNRYLSFRHFISFDFIRYFNFSYHFLNKLNYKIKPGAYLHLVHQLCKLVFINNYY